MNNELANAAAVLALAGLVVYLSLWPYMTEGDE
jgi:hypothetical protein